MKAGDLHDTQKTQRPDGRLGDVEKVVVLEKVVEHLRVDEQRRINDALVRLYQHAQFALELRAQRRRVRRIAHDIAHLFVHVHRAREWT